MFLIGVILFAMALILAFGGLFKVYCDISLDFDSLMKVIVVVIGIVALILVIASSTAVIPVTP